MTFFFYHKPVLTKKKCPLFANNSKLCACISYFTNIEWEQGCFVLENEKCCKNNNNKIKRSFQQTNFSLNHPSLLICYWSRKCAAPAKKINKYWNSMIGMKTEVTTNKILRFYVQHMTFILQLSKCRSRMSYRKGFESLYILRYNDVEKIWYSA